MAYAIRSEFAICKYCQVSPSVAGVNFRPRTNSEPSACIHEARKKLFDEYEHYAIKKAKKNAHVEKLRTVWLKDDIEKHKQFCRKCEQKKREKALHKEEKRRLKQERKANSQAEKAKRAEAHEAKVKEFIKQVKRQADEEAQKMIEAQVKKRVEVEVARRKTLEEERAKKKADEELAAKMIVEKEARKKAEAEAAKKKAEAEAEAKKKVEKELREKKLAEEADKMKAEMEAKKEAEASARAEEEAKEIILAEKAAGKETKSEVEAKEKAQQLSQVLKKECLGSLTSILKREHPSSRYRNLRGERRLRRDSKLEYFDLDGVLHKYKWNGVSYDYSSEAITAGISTSGRRPVQGRGESHTYPCNLQAPEPKSCHQHSRANCNRPPNSDPNRMFPYKDENGEFTTRSRFSIDSLGDNVVWEYQINGNVWFALHKANKR
ncbi:hypothetical protein CFIMG_000545RA [Ceratocystis fimbriata CBS 114723]|uniref:Uncharacterized protein n=1 Tax=Ceratocystis fimbriata CBS 114723 TaxID=1035309 RepID=A0A2C5XGM6_9PEZI|nr:hypothetical protein CFIMG_000545RA [Ceratocystis fimbriata CBS 114723]